MINNNNFVFIYNMRQAEFYFSKGIMPLSVGVGSKKDTYVKFAKSDELMSAFKEWCSSKTPVNK